MKHLKTIATYTYHTILLSIDVFLYPISLLIAILLGHHFTSFFSQQQFSWIFCYFFYQLFFFIILTAFYVFVLCFFFLFFYTLCVPVVFLYTRCFPFHITFFFVDSSSSLLVERNAHKNSIVIDLLSFQFKATEYEFIYFISTCGYCSILFIAVFY